MRLSIMVFSGCMPSTGTVGSHGRSSFLSNLHTALHSGRAAMGMQTERTDLWTQWGRSGWDE